ncbi:protein MpCupin22 [Marchantia polymorpha subsp. ruderalis]
MVKLAFIYSTCLVLVQRVEAADPDPLVDFSANATTPVFRNIFANGDVTTGSGGVRAALDIGKFPGLTSEGLTVVQFKMVPCGENVPHTHPRATELLSLISGGPLQAGFVDTKGETHINILYPGDLIVFPRGLLHFEVNVGTELAFYISAMNSQNPGTLDADGAVLQLPERAAAIALNIDIAAVRALKSQRPYNEPPTLEAAKPGVCVPGQLITTTV